LAADPQDTPRHAGQVVRRVLLRRNIVIDAETAHLVAVAVQAALQADAPRLPRRRPSPSTLERLRRDNTMIAANDSRHIQVWPIALRGRSRAAHVSCGVYIDRRADLATVGGPDGPEPLHVRWSLQLGEVGGLFGEHLLYPPGTITPRMRTGLAEPLAKACGICRGSQAK
jgi:hypothetical protein